MHLVILILLFVVGVYFFVSSVVTILGFDEDSKKAINGSEDSYLKYWIRRYYGGMSGIVAGLGCIVLSIILYLAN